MEDDKTHKIKLNNKDNQSNKNQPVRIIDFDMPFNSMVLFMIKWALASIPAIIIIFIFIILITMLFIPIVGTVMINTFKYIQ